MNTTEYKKWLIETILYYQTRRQFTKEELQLKTIKALEIIHDHID